MGIGTTILDPPQGRCISGMSGRVDAAGEPKLQDLSARVGGCGTLAVSDINHLRRYRQQGGAEFIAVSHEYLCGGWHCIVDNGFNRGRDHLVQNLLDVAVLKGWWIDVRDVRRPAGTGSNGVAYDDLVKVVTLKTDSPVTLTGSFEAVAGPACPQDWTREFATNPSSGWGAETEGQWQRDGCTFGPYLWTWANGGGWEADWIFHPPMDGPASCWMQAWVPATHSAVSTAKAHYQIFDTQWNRVHEVWIDQAKIGNAWAGDGFRTDAFRVNDPHDIRIVLTDENTGGALAIDAVKLGCRYVPPSGH